MEFKEFKLAVQRRFNEMVKKGPIFQAMIDKDEIWNLYLNSFPEGTNPIFRNRTEHDCSCCRSFVKRAGSMVQIENGELRSIWDLTVGGEYQVVADALSKYVKTLGIENVYLSTDSNLGVDKNREQLEENKIVTWEHFHVQLPSTLQCKNTEIGPRHSEYQAMHDVVLRSLNEITVDALETVQDLISQNSLYRGAEKKNLVDTFLKMKKDYLKIKLAYDQDLFAWNQVVGSNAWTCKIRNDVIGTLLVDLSTGVDLELAVKKFEDKVSGTNYKRPTALVTPRMRDEARKTIEELGLMSALDRRYAKLEDVSVTNVLFADRTSRKRMGGNIFDEISTTTNQSAKKFDKIEEVTIEKLISDILPSAKSLELYLENKHVSNLVSLVAPYDLTAKHLFKWDNPFSWSYNGEVADSIKERVKAAGGNVTGDLCCRLAWFNYDDLDFHMVESTGDRLYFGNKRSKNGGYLDVDMNAGGRTSKEPVENIVYTNRNAMKEGTYLLQVNQFRSRDATDTGFEVEIDFMGNLYSFSYPEKVRQGQYVDVAKIEVSKVGVKINPLLPSRTIQKDAWGLKTEAFHPVTAAMLSPNFWDDNQIGNKHYFFMLDGCKNDQTARGFYNEFLRSDLEPHRRTMELVGSKARTDETDDQMSGVGFSSTQRNSVILKVHGSFVRTIKVTF